MIRAIKSAAVFIAQAVALVAFLALLTAPVFVLAVSADRAPASIYAQR